MACTLTLTIVSESQEGTIGDDWKYDLEAKVFSGALVGHGNISVPKHTLASGDTQPPPGPPEPLVLSAGQPGDELRVQLHLKASEVDLLRNDVGETRVDFDVRCPPAGGAPVVVEREITVGVTEMPSQTATAEFKLVVTLSLTSD